MKTRSVGGFRNRMQHLPFCRRSARWIRGLAMGKRLLPGDIAMPERRRSENKVKGCTGRKRQANSDPSLPSRTKGGEKMRKGYKIRLIPTLEQEQQF